MPKIKTAGPIIPITVAINPDSILDLTSNLLASAKTCYKCSEIIITNIYHVLEGAALLHVPPVISDERVLHLLDKKRYPSKMGNKQSGHIG